MTSTYETVEGTEPVANGVHEPRTIQRVITPDERFDKDHDLHMMTEIGDGVFVQWSQCRKCTKSVYDCKCAGGPQEPEYMTRWRDDRFKKTLNERPDPSYDLLPSVIEWLKERGYEVTKSVEKQLEEAEPYDPTTHEPMDLTPEEADGFIDALSPDPEDEDKITAQVDGGLDEALARVREAKPNEDVGF